MVPIAGTTQFPTPLTAMVCASIPGQATATWTHAYKNIFSDPQAPVAKLPAILCAESKSRPWKLRGITKCRTTFSSQFLSPHARSLCNGNEVRPRTVMGLSGTPEDDDEYIEAQVLDAVRMSPAKSQLFMSMRDGSEVEVIHVNPSAGRLLYHSSTPTIFLRMVSDQELLLPIVVGELAIGLLMKAFRREHGGRPNHYEVMQNLVDVLQYEVRHVKVTQRVVDTYYARIYLGKPGESESSLLSVDARPSDAINLAVRSNVPIFVSKSIVLNDAVKVAYEPIVRGTKLPREGVEVVKDEVLDSPSMEPDAVSEEMNLVKNLVAAVSDERYTDAARLRDLLAKFRISGKRQLNKH